MRLLPTDEAHAEIAFTGFYELPLTQQIRALATSSGGGLMVDVGANYGYFSLLWAAASPKHRVIAFEASPRNHSPLRANVVQNGFVDRIDVRETAVGREAGTLEFSLGGSEETGWGSFSLVGASQTTSVPVVTLDDAVPADSSIDLLKIDDEGADTWVLRGARTLLGQKRIKHIFFEQNKERMASLGIAEQEPIDFLAQLGYDATPFTDEHAALVEYHAVPRAR